MDFFLKKMGQSSAVGGLKIGIGGPEWIIELSTRLYVIICVGFECYKLNIVYFWQVYVTNIIQCDLIGSI